MAWLRVLSLRDIADELTRSFDILEAKTRDIPQRQRSIRAVFDYSWHRLTRDEQVSFMKLAVFRGGFSRFAAADVAGANLQILATFADKDTKKLTMPWCFRIG